MFSRRGREGSALFQEFMISLHILGDSGDLWCFLVIFSKMEKICDF